MTDSLTPEALAELTALAQPPCLSLYQATHRRHPENQQDPVRFRQLVKTLETSLAKAHPVAEVRRLLQPFDALAQDASFWNHTLDGLAVLGGAGLFRVFRLQRPVAELAVVAESFHTKPLRRFLQSVERYQVLGLSLHKVRLFEGNRNVLDEVELMPGVPRTIDAALGNQFTEPHSTVSSYGGLGGGHMPMHHGQGAKKDEVDIDTERFFRAVDRAVAEHHSRPSGLPLILAALPEHHHLFRRVSHNPQLLEAGLLFNPDGVALDDLRERAWKVVEPQHRALQEKWAQQFAAAKSKGLGSDDPAHVAAAAASGRVATLLIESGRQLGGHLDRSTGRVDLAAELSDPAVDDLLDDLGELVEGLGGRVVVLPAGQMPGRTGLAATYRH